RGARRGGLYRGARPRPLNRISLWFVLVQNDDSRPDQDERISGGRTRSAAAVPRQVLLKGCFVVQRQDDERNRDGTFDLLALQGLEGDLDAEPAFLVRVLCDQRLHCPVLQRSDLGIGGIVCDDLD